MKKYIETDCGKIIPYSQIIKADTRRSSVQDVTTVDYHTSPEQIEAYCRWMETDSDMQEPWDFVRKYYPNYDDCPNIELISKMQKILNPEINKDNELIQLFAEVFENNPSKVVDKLHCLYVDAFDKAISAYIGLNQ